MNKEELIKKVKELLSAPSCCSEVSVAAQAYLDAAGTAGEKAAAKALQTALEENVNLIDDTISFFQSDAAKEAFGEEMAAEKISEAQKAKDEGARYCVCPACKAGGEILESHALLDEDEAVEAAPAAESDAQPKAEAGAKPVPAAEPETEDEAKAEDAPAETMDDYAQELEASFRRINEGDVLTGTVISVTETDITLDFGYYTDGIIHLEDASDDPSYTLKDRIQVGQTLSATVLKRDDGAGHILLSMKEAAQLMAWDRLRELKETKENVSVKITGITKGGAIAMLEGIRGFIPASKLALSYVEEEALNDWMGKSIDVRVIDADEAGRHLVLSAKEILREKAQEERAKKISNVEVGLVTEGKVETLKPYGAFINLGNGLSGLLHVSQISQKRIKHPGEVLKEGETVKVKIIANKDGKLSLSMKALEDVMAETVEEETYELPKSEAVTTSLGALFAKLKL